MKIETDLGHLTGYTRVPNQVIFEKDLPCRTLLLWIEMLASLKGEGSIVFANAADTAKHFNMSPDSFRDHRRTLKKKGYLVDRGHGFILTLPDEDPKPAPKVEKKPEKDLSIAQEESKKANRPKCKVSVDDRKVMIKEAWNKHKLQEWLPIDGKVAQPLYIAIEAMTKYLEHDRLDYEGLMKQVCNGARIHDWWSKKVALKPTALFGFGQPEDRKFENIKQLYTLGKTKQAASAGFDWSDQAFLDWFQSSTHGKHKTEVQRINVEDLEVDRQVDLDGIVDWRWTAVAYDRDVKPDNIIRLYMAPNKAKPVHWTGKESLHFMYTP